MHIQQPLVTVLIPTYRRIGGILQRAVDSALNQTYKNTEIIVLDDGTELPIQPMEYKIGKIDKFIHFKENRGKASVINDGIRMAKGKYIVFLDDDNELIPTFLEETVPLLQGTPSIVGAVQVGRIIKGKTETYARPYTGNFAASIDWGWLMKREVFDKIMLDEKMYADEDMDLGIEFFKRFTSVILDKPLEISHVNEEDSVCSPTPRRMKGMEYFVKKHRSFYKGNPNELRYLYRLAGRTFYRGGKRIKGLKYFYKSFFSQPSKKSFMHLLIIHFGWYYYDKYMTYEESKL